ncbi:MAG: PEP-CTERM sorting domain-containing protein [Prosthecobacter sp.]|uniref:PEP-CTERM sorting domain-containing protein n=1 Tax=Prosthecobacter sp. TaxID=1965333 RepID=UPI003BAE20C8
MLIKTKHFLTMLVVAGISAAAIPSKAATFVAGDLLLGFRATGGTGSTSNLIVDLGLATGYRDATSNIASVVDIGSLLVSTYGSDWATRSDLSWGIVGARTNSTISAAVGGDPARTDYLSAAQSTITPGTQQSTAWVVGSAGRADTTADILGLGVAYAAAPGTTSAVLNSTDAGSWSTNNSGSDSFRVGGTIEGNFANGASGTALDLYRVLNTNTGANPTGTVGVGSYEGTFTISSAGVVGFTAAEAVPEPSRAILAAVGLGGLLLRRRRSVKA